MNYENEMILEQAKSLYGVALVKEIGMGMTGNRVFEVKRAQTAYIIRASEHTPEKERHTDFELSWMLYLSGTLSAIVRPQKSIRGNILEVIDVSGKAFILCMFEKAPGKTVDSDNPKEFNEALYFNLGALMGDMHRLTVEYRGNIRRPEFEWTGSPNAWRYDNVILDDDVRRCQNKYFCEIKTLPIGKDNYGIIHWDIHADNFFVDNGRIKLFDFDACQMNWYTADMASAIFFMVLKGAGPLSQKGEKERTEFAQTYLISYLRGYTQTYTASEFWIRRIDLFIKYQMCDEYLAAQTAWPEELAHLRDWYMNWHKERIVNGLPYVFIDYEKILHSLPSIRS